MKPINARIHNLISEDKKKYSQKGMSAYTGIPESTISNWLKMDRDIPADKIIPISEYLGVSYEYLLTGEEKSPPILNKEEQKMLDLFRKLPAAGRDRMINRAEGYLEGVEDTLSQASASKDSQASGN